MNTVSAHLDRLRELSVDAVLNELSAEDAAEYARLRSTYPTFDAGPTEQAVGVALAGLLGDGESPPDTLLSRLEADLDVHFAPRATVVDVPTTARHWDRTPRRSWPWWSGWLAAAASLLVAVGAWWYGAGQKPLAPSAERAALLHSGRALVSLTWAAGGDQTGAQTRGDVVWDPERQIGYMRFTGLAPNDPRREQYQLWIFDAQRDERYPVDGGVFDVDAEGEVVIPIRARLHVADAQLFAVTVEKPGGVVVSDRSRIAVLAKRG